MVYRDHGDGRSSPFVMVIDACCCALRHGLDFELLSLNTNQRDEDEICKNFNVCLVL